MPEGIEPVGTSGYEYVDGFTDHSFFQEHGVFPWLADRPNNLSGNARCAFWVPVCNCLDDQICSTEYSFVCRRSCESEDGVTPPTISPTTTSNKLVMLIIVNVMFWSMVALIVTYLRVGSRRKKRESNPRDGLLPLSSEKVALGSALPSQNYSRTIGHSKASDKLLLRTPCIPRQKQHLSIVLERFTVRSAQLPSSNRRNLNVCQYKNDMSELNHDRQSKKSVHNSIHSTVVTKLKRRIASDVQSITLQRSSLRTTLDVSQLIVKNIAESLTSELLTPRAVVSPQQNAEAWVRNLNDYLFSMVRGLDHWYTDDTASDACESIETAGIRCLLMSTIYLKRMKQVDASFSLTICNVHKLLAVLMLIAARLTEEEEILNVYWSQVCDFSVSELTSLETALCAGSFFSFAIKEADLLPVYIQYNLDEFEMISSEVGTHLSL